MVLEFGASHFEADRLSENAFERADVPMRRPELQFRVPAGTQACEVVVAARIEIDAGERLGVAPVEPLADGHHAAGQVTVTVVRLLGFGLAVITRDQRDRLDLRRIEAAGRRS